jgi:ATP-dependent exoDNAse (exonuclease V) beta subunit
VRPGRHLCEGSVEVIWWDPSALPDAQRVSHGLQNHELLMAKGQAADRSEAQHDSWKQAREALLERGARPELQVTSPRDLADAAIEGDGPAASGDAIPAERTAVQRAGRPPGRRFGALVHAVLAEVPLDSDLPVITLQTSAQARRIGATEAEIAAAVAAVEATLAHPLLRRAAGALEVRREDPLLLRLEDGGLVEGVLDLAFRDADGWTVVEFKTSLPTRVDAQKAAEQTGWYVRAVAEATGEHTTGVVLLV